LRDKSQLIGVGGGYICHILNCLDQGHGPVGQLPHRTNDLDMAFVPDHQDFVSLPMQACDLHMDFCHQWTDGVDGEHLPPLGLFGDRFRHTMCGKHHGSVSRTVVKRFHKDRTLITQAIHDVFVVNDFVAHVDGCAKFVDGHLDHLDRTINPGAKAARGCKV